MLAYGHNIHQVKQLLPEPIKYCLASGYSIDTLDHLFTTLKTDDLQRNALAITGYRTVGTKYVWTSSAPEHLKSIFEQIYESVLRERADDVVGKSVVLTLFSVFDLDVNKNFLKQHIERNLTDCKTSIPINFRLTNLVDLDGSGHCDPTCTDIQAWLKDTCMLRLHVPIFGSLFHTKAYITEDGLLRSLFIPDFDSFDDAFGWQRAYAMAHINEFVFRSRYEQHSLISLPGIRYIDLRKYLGKFVDLLQKQLNEEWSTYLFMCMRESPNHSFVIMFPYLKPSNTYKFVSIIVPLLTLLPILTPIQMKFDYDFLGRKATVYVSDLPYTTLHALIVVGVRHNEIHVYHGMFEPTNLEAMKIYRFLFGKTLTYEIDLATVFG